MKKVFSCVCMTIIFLFISTSAVFSFVVDDVSVLENCRELYSEINSDGAYLYGYTIKCVYSAKVLPNVNIRKLEVSGKIRSVSHYKSKTVALVEVSIDNFEVVVLDNNTGIYDYYKFNNMSELDVASFAFENNRVYFVKTDSNYNYVQSYSLSGELLHTYKFGKQLCNIFGNNSKTYVRMYDGTIYRLSENTYEYIAEIDRNSSISNAGANWIFSGTELISLDNNQKETVYNGAVNCVAYNNGKVINSRNKTLCINGTELYKFNKEVEFLLSYENLISAITVDFSSITLEIDMLENDENCFLNSPNEQTYKINSDGIIYGVESGTTVSLFKKSYNTENVYDKNGYEVTNGKMKTGYRALINGKNRLISIRGDITGEGNVKSNDVSALMSALSGKTKLSNIQSVSADYNFDGKVNNIDLVLIAQNVK